MSAVGKCLVGEYPGWEMTKSGNDRREISGRDIAGWEMVLHLIKYLKVASLMANDLG